VFKKFIAFFLRQNRLIKTPARIAARIVIWILGRLRGFAVLPETVSGSFEMLLGAWEKGTAATARIFLHPGMVAVDVGAHVGYFTRIFSSAVGPAGKVFAFEPHPVNFGFLKKNTRRLKNTVLIQAAVASQNGQLTLYESSVGSGSHSLHTGRYPVSQELDVKSVTLDAYFGDRRINLIKIDVEGAELEVLEGAKNILGRSDAPALVIEFAPGVIRSLGFNPADLIRRIRGFGYQIFAIDEEKYTRTPLASWKSEEEFIRSVKKYVNLFCTKGSTV